MCAAALSGAPRGESFQSFIHIFVNLSLSGSIVSLTWDSIICLSQIFFIKPLHFAIFGSRPRAVVSAILEMYDSFENAFAALGLCDSESDDTLTPVGEPSVPIGQASRRHSYDPYGRLSDGEAVHYDTPQPSGRKAIPR